VTSCSRSRTPGHRPRLGCGPEDHDTIQAELGWVLDPAHTGHGYETEAVRELLRVCFDELDLRRVVAKCFSDNEASWRLMERLGMRRELHAVRESLHRSGEWLDVYGYAMLACERPIGLGLRRTASRPA
jgi:RimJ/RimL family protein N-acetyltransferase